MVDSVDLEEMRARGKILEIRSPFLPKQPIVYDDTPAADSMLEWKQASIHQARDLAEQVVVQLPPARVETVCQLATAQREANQTLNDARARLATLSAPLPADTDLDTLTQQEGQRAALVRHIPTLQARAHAANDALGAAIGETRSYLEIRAHETVLRQVRDEMHDLDAQIEGLQQRRDDLDRAARDAKAMLTTWGSTGYHPPIISAPVQSAPPAQPAAVPKRRKLFG